MLSITMSKKDTRTYDRGDDIDIHQLRKKMREKAARVFLGETVLIYTSDGIVAWVVTNR